MNIPVPYTLVELFKRYNLAESILNGKLDTVLLQTITERQYTNEEVMAFLTNDDSPIMSLLVVRKFFFNGLYKYSVEEYTKNGKKISVHCQETDKAFYVSMVATLQGLK